MQKISIHEEKKIKDLLEKNGHKSFRYTQIENAFYKNFITNFIEMNTLSKEIRELLDENVFIYSLKIEEIKTSENGQTTKMLFKTDSGDFIESVIMRHLTGRVTLCVSCQAGCPMGCSFCATGKMGLKRNLEQYEILEQIYFAAKLLYEEGNKLRNVVYMGMGEPFLNYENVKKSIEVVNGQKKFDLSKRRITISTCGIIPGIERFMQDFSQTSLAVSLHAPNDEVRQKIMPVAKKYPLKELMKSLDEYVAKTNKKIFYEYIMINGVNDDIKLAHELGKLLEGKLAHVNFIPYNSGRTENGESASHKKPLPKLPLIRGRNSSEKGKIDCENFQPTPRIIIEKFQTILQHYGVVSTIRATLGDDIDAACGQLVSRTEKGKK